MNNSKFRFTLELHSMQSQISMPVKLGDTAVSLYISLMDGGIPYVIEDGCRAVFCAKKADGTTLLNNCVIEKNSIVRYDFTKETATAEGIARCEITLYNLDGEVLGSPKFVFVVDKGVLGSEDVISQSESTAITEILILGSEAVAKEAERQANEEQRKANEEQRWVNDAQRQANEEQRQDAELAREAAEQTRNYYPSLAIRIPTFDATTGVMSFETIDGTSGENITLSTPSQGGGGGGDKLYMHNVKIDAEDWYGYSFATIYIHTVSKSNTPINSYDALCDIFAVPPAGTWNFPPVGATGWATYENTYGSVVCAYIYREYLRVQFKDQENNETGAYFDHPDSEQYGTFTFADEVREVV